MLTESWIGKSKPVLTKADFVRRYRLGEFGNHSPTWGTLGEYLDSNYSGRVHIRNRVAGGPTYYNLSQIAVIATFKYVPYNPKNWYISAMAPHEHNLIQGEVWDGPGGLYLHGSFERNLPMRDALTVAPLDWHGLQARMLLRSVMNDLSWNWFQWLLEAYPDHVIEFSAFSQCWGTVPGHNVVIWEVRNY